MACSPALPLNCFFLFISVCRSNYLFRKSEQQQINLVWPKQKKKVVRMSSSSGKFIAFSGPTVQLHAQYMRPYNVSILPTVLFCASYMKFEQQQINLVWPKQKKRFSGYPQVVVNSQPSQALQCSYMHGTAIQCEHIVHSTILHKSAKGHHVHMCV